MSQETAQWLNTMVLVGFTDLRGTAWHYRASEQGQESNHYPGAIPVDDVLRRLFNFEVVERPLYFYDPSSDSFIQIEDRKAMVTDDTADVLGVFKQGYKGHQYQEWLIENIAAILDDDVQIGSAGLLKNRGQAWVSIETPENQSVSGFAFRPHIVCATSFDGSLSTTYKGAVTAVVCDNTLSAAMSEDGQVFKLRHSKYSTLHLADAREALGLIFNVSDAFEAEVAALLDHKVSEHAWQKVLDLVVPLPEDDGRGKTMAENKRDKLQVLYKTDERCEPWKGTALGVLQAFNTWNHHYATVRKGVPRVLRNMENVISGKFDAADDAVMAAVVEATK